MRAANAVVGEPTGYVSSSSMIRVVAIVAVLIAVALAVGVSRGGPLAGRSDDAVTSARRSGPDPAPATQGHRLPTGLRASGDRAARRTSPAVTDAGARGDLVLRSSHDLPIDGALWWAGEACDRQSGGAAHGLDIRAGVTRPRGGAAFAALERPCHLEAPGHLPVRVGEIDTDLVAEVDQLVDCVTAGARYALTGVHHNDPAVLGDALAREVSSTWIGDRLRLAIGATALRREGVPSLDLVLASSTGPPVALTVNLEPGARDVLHLGAVSAPMEESSAVRVQVVAPLCGGGRRDPVGLVSVADGPRELREAGEGRVRARAGCGWAQPLVEGEGGELRGPAVPLGSELLVRVTLAGSADAAAVRTRHTGAPIVVRPAGGLEVLGNVPVTDRDGRSPLRVRWLLSTVAGDATAPIGFGSQVVVVERDGSVRFAVGPSWASLEPGAAVSGARRLDLTLSAPGLAPRAVSVNVPPDACEAWIGDLDLGAAKVVEARIATVEAAILADTLDATRPIRVTVGGGEALEFELALATATGAEALQLLLAPLGAEGRAVSDGVGARTVERFTAPGPGVLVASRRSSPMSGRPDLLVADRGGDGRWQPRRLVAHVAELAGRPDATVAVALTWRAGDATILVAERFVTPDGGGAGPIPFFAPPELDALWLQLPSADPPRRAEVPVGPLRRHRIDLAAEFPR